MHLLVTLTNKLNRMINIYLITGFLGSGKTTFLNHFLKYHSSSKNLVIENEFGKINIDAQLITEKIDGVIELTNGCLCCSLDNELIEVLGTIIKSENKPNNIFIETTGIADARNIIDIINSPVIKKYFNFKSCICIIDAENIESRLAETFETAKQIAVSNILIVNKLNNLGKHYFATVEKLLLEINPFGKIVKSCDGSIDFRELEEVITTNKNSIPSTIGNTSLKTVHKINTVYFETNDAFDLDKLKHVLHVNFLLYPHQLFRLKGFVNTMPNNFRYLIQSTGKQVQFTKVLNNNNEIKSELVFIGLQLKTETIKRILRPAMYGVKNNVN